MESLIGKTLGHYKILSEIGRGGMAIVYRGEQSSLGRAVAVKVLSGELAHDPDFRQRFQREAYAVAQLVHPNILPVYDFGEDQATGAVYFVMQFVDGGTLAQRMSQAIPPEEGAHIAAQIARALDMAHSRGIIHRDVKPANVLMTREGHPLLSDFGIAKIAAETKLTRTGTNMGTPIYMSPEQAQGRPVDHRADIYALGVMLYEILAGVPPFEADTPVTLLHLHATKEPPPLRERAARVPRGLERIVMQALAKDPEDRFATAGEMADALEAEIGIKRKRPSLTPRSLTSWLRRDKPTPTPTPASTPVPGSPTVVDNSATPTPTPAPLPVTDLRRRPRPRLMRTLAKLPVGRAAKGFGYWLFRTILGALGVLLIVALVLAIGGAFAFGALAEQALASQRWVLDTVHPGDKELVACQDIQNGVSLALQPYLLDALTDITASCSSPDLVEMKGLFRGGPVSFRVRVFERSHAPAIQFESFNHVPLYIVGGIVSDGVNRGIARSWTKAPVRLGKFTISEPGIEIEYEANGSPSN